MVLGLPLSSFAKQQSRQRAMCIGQVWPARDGCLERRDGTSRVVLLFSTHSDLVMRHGVVAFPLQSSPKAKFRQGDLPLIVGDAALVVMAIRSIGGQSQGHIQRLLGADVVALQQVSVTQR